jgi:hypothetical protein
MFRFNRHHQGAYYLSFAKAQIMRSLMVVIEPKHVGAVLM